MEPNDDLIGPYKLGKTLGKGSTGMMKASSDCQGTVRLGVHTSSGQQVAVKIINKSDVSCAGSKSFSKWEKEMNIMKLIRHPNVLKLLEVFDKDSQL
jgi:serine/threonine protein kinase